MYRKLGLLAGTILSFAIAPVSAADLPQVGYTNSPPIYSWSGFYVGVNAGYTVASRNHMNFSGTDTGTDGLGTTLGLGLLPSQATLRPDGVIGGGQIGYNWQSDIIVYGIEADIQGSSGKDNFRIVSLPPSTPITVAGSNNLEWLSTVRGRFGITATPMTLLYLTGGLAIGETKLNISGSCPTCVPALASAESSNKISTGWTIGAGAEWALAGGWSVKGEYLYYDLGSAVATLTYDYVTWTSTLTAHASNSGHVTRIGVNYKFHN
jgi:outer membrane immunogenic protein